jgi:hypothetical protein
MGHVVGVAVEVISAMRAEIVRRPLRVVQIAQAAARLIYFFLKAYSRPRAVPETVRRQASSRIGRMTVFFKN